MKVTSQANSLLLNSNNHHNNLNQNGGEQRTERERERNVSLMDLRGPEVGVVGVVEEREMSG